MAFFNSGLGVSNFSAFDLRFDFSMPRSTLCWILRQLSCDYKGFPGIKVLTQSSDLKKQHFDTWETFLMASNRPQNLTQGRSRHGEAESEVESWRFLHPEAKIKENRPNIFFQNPIFF